MYDVFTSMHVKTFGLFPHLIDVNTGDPIGGNVARHVVSNGITLTPFLIILDHVTWGGMGDSFYEVGIKITCMLLCVSICMAF